jgi:hypothetical protein
MKKTIFFLFLSLIAISSSSYAQSDSLARYKISLLEAKVLEHDLSIDNGYANINELQQINGVVYSFLDSLYAITQNNFGLTEQLSELQEERYNGLYNQVTQLTAQNQALYTKTVNLENDLFSLTSRVIWLENEIRGRSNLKTTAKKRYRRKK